MGILFIDDEEDDQMTAHGQGQVNFIMGIVRTIISLFVAGLITFWFTKESKRDEKLLELSIGYALHEKAINWHDARMMLNEKTTKEVEDRVNEIYFDLKAKEKNHR